MFIFGKLSRDYSKYYDCKCIPSYERSTLLTTENPQELSKTIICEILYLLTVLKEVPIYSELTIFGVKSHHSKQGPKQ